MSQSEEGQGSGAVRPHQSTLVHPGQQSDDEVIERDGVLFLAGSGLPIGPARYHGNGRPEPVSPVETKDSQGRSVFLVPIYHAAKKFHAAIDPDDWERLHAKGYPMDWSLETHVRQHRRYHYVVTGCFLNVLNVARVARLILDAAPGEIVRHLNGNPLDLRRANLIIP